MPNQILAEEFPPVCRDCGQPLDVIHQPRFTGGHITLVTCWQDCLLNGVTLPTDEYNRLSESNLEAYRAVKRAKLARVAH